MIKRTCNLSSEKRPIFHNSCLNIYRKTPVQKSYLTEYLDTCGFGIFDKIGIKKHIMLYSNYLVGMHGGIYGIPQTPSYVPGWLLNLKILFYKL